MVIRKCMWVCVSMCVSRHPVTFACKSQPKSVHINQTQCPFPLAFAFFGQWDKFYKERKQDKVQKQKKLHHMRIGRITLHIVCPSPPTMAHPCDVAQCVSPTPLHHGVPNFLM